MSQEFEDLKNEFKMFKMNCKKEMLREINDAKKKISTSP